MPESDIAKWIFIGFLGSMVINAIFPHLIATVVMKKYAPGLLTGLLLNIPVNSLVIYQMNFTGMLSNKPVRGTLLNEFKLVRIEGKGRNFLNNGLFCISDFYKTMS